MITTPSSSLDLPVAPRPSGLRRVLRLHGPALLIVGTVIASGSFLISGAVLKAAGSSAPAAHTEKRRDQVSVEGEGVERRDCGIDSRKSAAVLIEAGEQDRQDVAAQGTVADFDK